MTEIARRLSQPLPPSSLATRGRSWRYAARPDSEAALCRLTALLRAGATRVAFVGAPASGKTLLLHVLPERLGPAFASVYLPNPALGPDQVRPWLETCAEPVPADAGTSLADLALAHARRGPGLVLLVDDADDMPAEVADAFGATLAQTDDQLRLVLAGADEARLDEVLARLGGRAERVRLGAAPHLHEGASPEEPLRPAPAKPTPWTAPSRTAPALAAALLRPAPVAPPVAPIAAAAPAPAALAPAALASRRRPWARSLVTAGGALLAAIALVLAARYAPDRAAPDRARAPEVAVAAAPPPAVATAASLPVAEVPPVLVHVNARPWARIRVDDRELGLTPLGNVPLAPGLRRFRAEMADGSVIEREVTIDGASRRVTFP